MWMTERLTEDQRRRMLVLYIDRVPVKEIAKKFGVHHSYVSLLARRRGLKLRNNRRNIRYETETTGTAPEREPDPSL